MFMVFIKGGLTLGYESKGFRVLLRLESGLKLKYWVVKLEKSLMSC